MAIRSRRAPAPSPPSRATRSDSRGRSSTASTFPSRCRAPARQRGDGPGGGAGPLRGRAGGAGAAEGGDAAASPLRPRLPSGAQAGADDRRPRWRQGPRRRAHRGGRAVPAAEQRIAPCTGIMLLRIRPQWPQVVAESRRRQVVEGKDKLEQGREIGRRLWGEARFDQWEKGLADIHPVFHELALETWSLYARPGVDLRTRSLCTIAALAVLGHADVLRLHIFGALNNGVSQLETEEG